MVFSRLAKGAAAAASVTLALLLIAHAWNWHRGASWIEDAIAGWSDDIRERGGRVEIEDLAVGGYPFGFEVRAASVLVEAGEPSSAWPWRGAAVRTKGLTADLEIAGSGLGSLTAALEDGVVAGHELPGPIAFESATVFGARGRRSDARGAFRLTGRIRRARLPVAPSSPLDTVVDGLAWDLAVHPPLAIPASVGALAAWRDDGGTVEIDSLALDWGALTVDASGTLSLDRRFRPIAALSATVRGHRALADALVRAGTIRPAEGAAAKILLGALSAPADGGGIVVPVTAQDGWLAVGPSRIFRLPPVVSVPAAEARSRTRRASAPRPDPPP